MSNLPAPQSVLILCPHNAAKSVFAAAYASRLAASRGHQLAIGTGGTDPDPDLLPVVRTRLEDDAYEIGVEPPRRVTADDLKAAEIIVNIGCDHDELPTSKPIRDWKIPNFSDDPAAAFAALEQQVEALIDELFPVGFDQ